MRRNWKPATLTLDEFIKLAGDRGVRLWTFEDQGVTWITNGARRHPLRRRLSGYLSADYLNNLCRIFSLPPEDFTLNPEDED